jgi:hypothetical protein
MRPDPRRYLWDAVRAAELARGFAEGRSFADYQSNAMLRSAVERQFEIVGEGWNAVDVVGGVRSSVGRRFRACLSGGIGRFSVVDAVAECHRCEVAATAFRRCRR